MTLRQRLVDAALEFGTFTLRSGAVSDRYFDKYRITSMPDLLGETCAELNELLQQLSPQARGIVVPALGAVPLGAGLALASGLPFAIVRDQAKDYGPGRGIEGTLITDGPVVLVEDVVTSGGAALAAAEHAREAGAQIQQALCVLDRDGGGRQTLAAAGIALASILTAQDIDQAVSPSHTL